ncbi:anti-ECFsigma factor, ChrR [Marinobacter persicus]|uniref:Anti-ECFsigma factor, ChrR n=1 Tax=Marinobacter persicus TaxID=930118 RepID=A0A1I3T4L6_9GAMM|nr:ChrR family anti-sigma-E factor [Marinobacter persicus]GHD40390.1 transcriptional regulator [Marinobacter persicus]SFJ65573.1 anti-ECFsigma factor, ChrR [Marinobacter persicus]
MTRHHPDSLTLMEYSAGNLTEPRALCIRLHLAECSHCRSRVDTLDSLGAVMMDQQPKVTVSETSFEQLMARIDAAPEDTSPVVETPRLSPIQKLLGDDLDNLPWKRQLGDVSVLDITDKFADQSERVVLQKLCAGGKAPAHTHKGDETTVILQGAFADKNGVFNQWDFVSLDEHDEHRPVAVGNEDCITLSVLSAPLKLTGTFTRLLNPFIR